MDISASLSCAMFACIILPTLAAPAQNPTPAQPAANKDATYRKLNQILPFIKSRNATTYAIDLKNGIDESTYLPIGGIDQWVTIRGQNRTNPVLLFLHGGPGDVTTPWSYPYFASWENHFTIVQWDQRGAGRTLRKSGSNDLTLNRMSQDGIELTQYLCKHLGKQKIVLVAHSFGTILGLRMIQSNPGLFYAYVGTGQVADETRNYSVAYDALLKKARSLNNQQALSELKTNDYQVQRKWSNLFEGANAFLYGTLGLTLVSPGYSVEDLNSSMDGQMLSADRLVPQTRTATMKDLGLTFAVPIFFFEGTEDFTTPTELAHEYLQTLQAPQKKFVPILGGHFAVFMNSDQFLDQLITQITPLVRQE
jgi:pimeloyl-ACP methyl ester carboxylesterase